MNLLSQSASNAPLKVHPPNKQIKHITLQCNINLAPVRLMPACDWVKQHLKLLT